MTEPKFTPGPWAMPDKENGLVSKVGFYGGWEGIIATVDCGDYARSRAEGLANAHLIAAAPELYEALEELMYARTDKAEQMAEAALKKARGEA